MPGLLRFSRGTIAAGMAPNPESPAIEWRDDAKLLTLCMLCNTDVPATESRCPRCQSAVSVVHRCPGCARLVAAKHLRCPYCSESFLKGDEPVSRKAITADALLDAQNQLREEHLRQRRKAMRFSAVVFLTVFALAAAFLYYRPGAGGDAVVLADSFVLHDVVLRQSGSPQSPALGRLAPPTVVEITGLQQNQGLDWFQIKWGKATAYVPVTDLAPPKGRNAEDGYTLLRISLLRLAHPSELENARQAVQLYRNRYPAGEHGGELSWLLAEKTRELGLRTRDARALADARKAYQTIAQENGKHSAEAAEALAHLSEAPAGRSLEAAGPVGSASGVPGSDSAPAWSVYNDQAGARKVMLLDQAEISVVFSAMQPLTEGEVLTGRVARAVVSNRDTVVAAGTLCRVKVVSVQGSGESASVELSLVEMQIGNTGYPVDAAPVRVRLKRTPGRNAHVLFRLRRTLVLAQ